MKKVKTTIIGCGRVAEHYKKIIKKYKIKNLLIVGVCDLDKKKALNFSKFFKCKYYKDFKKMQLLEKPKLTLVLSPSGYHYMHSKHALENNINVLTEKPMTMLPENINKLNKIAKKNKLMYGVVFQNRENLAIQALKKALKQKRFGKIVNISVNIFWCRYQDYYNDGWHGTWKNDGGVLNQQAIHHVDVLNWLFGPIHSVFAKSTKRLNKLQAEDTIIVAFENIDGVLGTIQATTAARPTDYEASIKVFGEKGYVQIGGIALNKILVWNFLSKKKNDTQIKKKYSETVDSGYGNSHSIVLNKTLKRLISNNFNALVSADQAENTSRLIHSIYNSCENKKLVLLNKRLLSKKLGLNN
ncbi:putative dehydrogenase [Candidatus Pelagibacter ubique]|uniref:Dehydrogenase n=1 Tax=Pelagibacter ubique TaxID=198252 RepID=A0ABX1T2I5_PELUQ|nr:Gfo/Idh/MocA family oxidoreductase [Candidatus Pelagibacter ubique]NMN67086.1 putative dehydrogenase [Candidatus Pelagibacter ubique]